MSNLDEVVSKGLSINASDIHFDATSEGGTIRYRVYGELMGMDIFDKGQYIPLIASLKIRASLRVDERYVPQDGRYSINRDGKACADIRVSVVPTIHGESAVMRLLIQDTQFDFDRLVLPQSISRKIIEILDMPHGLIVIGGPTGSGKTTTLYTFAKVLSEKGHIIVSIEDPVEYTVPWMRQIPVRFKGIGFGSGLRAIMRQDPDVIMIGEIRDSDTAERALYAAMTGHLVVASIHCTRAIDIPERLISLGCEMYMIQNTIALAVSQRLIKSRMTMTASVGRVPLCEIYSFNRKNIENIISFKDHAKHLIVNEMADEDQIEDCLKHFPDIEHQVSSFILD